MKQARREKASRECEAARQKDGRSNAQTIAARQVRLGAGEKARACGSSCKHMIATLCKRILQTEGGHGTSMHAGWHLPCTRWISKASRSTKARSKISKI